MDTMKVSKYLICFLLLDSVFCEVYKVGDENGWNSGMGTNYLSWSGKYNFSVGDVLVFKYSKLQHDVKEVTETTYRSCDATNGVLATYESGQDEITLSKERRYNFICDRDDHCIGGMRFTIYVHGASKMNNTTPIGPTPPPPSPGTNSAFTIRGTGVHTVGIGVLAMFLF